MLKSHMLNPLLSATTIHPWYRICKWLYQEAQMVNDLKASKSLLLLLITEVDAGKRMIQLV